MLIAHRDRVTLLMGFVEGIDMPDTRVIMTITFVVGMIRDETYTSRDAAVSRMCRGRFGDEAVRCARTECVCV